MDKADNDCPLSASVQQRNLILYGVNVSLVYVAAPALYIGSIHAALLEKLEFSKAVANLPLTFYYALSPMPILVSWYFCSFRQLVPVLVASYLITAAACASVVAALLLPLGESQVFWVCVAVLLQSAFGCALYVIANFQWEVLGRGVAQERRGVALGLAFGAGPVLAFLSALGTQAIHHYLEYPWNFATLFAIGVPTMILAAFLSSWFTIPRPASDAVRLPFVQGVFGGIGEFMSYRVTLFAALATFLVACGYNVTSNQTLFTQEAVGHRAEDYMGYQNAIRFAFKMVAGLFLGWLLTRSHPRAGLMVTGGLCLASVIWIMVAPGLWFLLAFGLMGAGELWGVYYPNYVLDASAKSRMRRNMAINTLMYTPSAAAPYLYGLIADRYGSRTSFVISLIILVATLLFVQILLPARPSPAADVDEPNAS